MLVTVLDTAFANVDAVIDDAGGLHLTLLAAGWTLLDEIDDTPGAQDRVYKSTGESGVEALYLRATHMSAADQVAFRAYSFWNATLHLGYNEVGDTLGGTCIQLDDAGVTIWMVATKDHVALVAQDSSGGYNKFFGGNVTRRQPAHLVGLTTLQGPVAGFNESGDTQLLVSTSTDFTKFAVDQYLWVVSQSASGPSSAERVQVLGLDPAAKIIYLTTGLTFDYGAAALVGTDTQPLVLWGDADGTLEGATPIALHNSTSYEPVDLVAGSLSAVADLTGDNYVPIFQYWLWEDSGDYFAGGSPRFLLAPSGLADEDDLEDGTDAYVYFLDGSAGVALKVT
jgi:hypothetical protein